MDKLLRQFFNDWRSAKTFRQEYRRVSRLTLTLEELEQIDNDYDSVEEAFESEIEAMADMNTSELAIYLLVNRDPFKYARALKASVEKRWKSLH